MRSILEWTPPRSRITSLAGCAFMLLLASACVHAPAIQTPEEEEREEEAGTPLRIVPLKDIPDLKFTGSTRATAKTKMAAASTVSYSSISAVTSLTKPEVTKTSDRTGVENNLATFTAWIYAYNMPADNDLHVILGDTATFTSGTTQLINVEVSGLPNSGDTTAFRKARVDFLTLVGNPPSVSSAYKCLDTPVKVVVSGGPFWDVSHPSGGSGTTTCKGNPNLKTTNGWELHPVNSLQAATFSEPVSLR